jgi:hypothetical protein
VAGNTTGYGNGGGPIPNPVADVMQLSPYTVAGFSILKTTNPPHIFRRGEEKRMLPSAVTDIKAFVPAKDLDVSKAFYSDLGFTINFSNDQIAELQIGSYRFLLQKFYVAEHVRAISRCP